MPDLRSGSVLANRYTLKRRLGGGALADTWLATDRMTRASVALKILTDDKGTSLLRREWQLSLRLMHAHIVRVFEFSDAGDAVFYSQQFIDGPDIAALQSAPPEHSLPAVAAIADALRYAHAKGIVHKDIKASNVLLDRNGAPYLIDFGVAAADSEDIGGGSLIASSPQLLDGRAAEPSDDVFALGGLMYELLTGEAPYSSARTAEDIRHSAPPELPEGLKVDADVAALLKRMLDKDADVRPTAAEVRDVLCAAGFAPGTAPTRYLAEAGEPEAAVPAATIQPRTRPRVAEASGSGSSSGLRPSVVGGALAILLLLLVGVVFLLPQRVSNEQTAGEPEPSTEVRSAAPADNAKEAVTDAGPAAEAASEPSLREERVASRAAAEEVLGELLAKFETLEGRAVARWGGLPYKRASAAYEAGDAAYLQRDYAAATRKYREAIRLADPLLERADEVFDAAMRAGEAALQDANTAEAIDQFELAVAMSANSTAARNGLERARNLDTVLDLIEQGRDYEQSLELAAARRSFSEAVQLDPEWEPAAEGLERVEAAITQMQFEARMSEGIAALESQDFLAARAAFRRAAEIRPGAPQAADGLLQVDQALRLQSIRELEARAAREEASEQWEEAVETYGEILDIDATLAFAQDGLRRARERAELHATIDDYVEDPDSLSSPRTLQQATNLLISITRMGDIGPRLAAQRDELSRLLKRASTPLTVELLSDNKTAVSIYKVGRLGTFESREVELRPGTYVAVGSRPGFRDVRLEFRVGPEIDMQPVVVQCEEPI